MNAAQSNVFVWHPSGVHPVLCDSPEVSAWLRPPATFWHPSGVLTPFRPRPEVFAFAATSGYRLATLRVACLRSIRYTLGSPSATVRCPLLMNSPLLQLTSVTKSFGAVRALKGVSFDLQAGEVHALLGENGAGKSTLIKVITGAHQPDGGTIEIAGQRRRAPHARRRAQTRHRLHLPAARAVSRSDRRRKHRRCASNPPPPSRRVNWPERRARAAQLLQRIGAEISPDAEVRSLSMPEQQLVEIACALGAGARIVIMDEPTASLTQKEQSSLLFAVVRDLRASGVGVIYISHRLEEIFRTRRPRDGVARRRKRGNARSRSTGVDAGSTVQNAAGIRNRRLGTTPVRR